MIDVASLIRPEIRALSAYHVPNAEGLVKLDAMENPYTWPAELVDAWLARLREARLNRYPDPAAANLKRRLRQSMEMAEDVELMLGNGSDELIQIIIMAVSGPGRVVMAPEPSFAMYRMAASFTGMDYVGVPLNAADFRVDVAAMLSAMERHRPPVVFLAYPNNPTGNRFDESSVREIIASAPGLVVVDEAYFAFTDHSFLANVGDYDNLLVMRTISKLGLAGLRVGLLVGAARWMAELEKLRLPYNINVLSQISAEFALEHGSVLGEQIQRIRSDRGALLSGLRMLPGITAFPSETNFILFRAPQGKADHLFASLLEAGVLIKNLSPAGGLLRDCLRVTVGTTEENRVFLDALKAAL